MKPSRARFPLLVCLAFAAPAMAERGIVQVYQPISLLGTEMEGDPLGTGESLAAMIVSRPVLVGGAFPESWVEAILLPHKIAGAPEGFPVESNLLVLVGAELSAEWGEGEHRIVADFSKARVPGNLGVSLIHVMKLCAKCLQLTLGDQIEQPALITWVAPAGVSLGGAGLPREIARTGKH